MKLYMNIWNNASAVICSCIWDYRMVECDQAQDCIQKQVTDVGDPSDYAPIILAYV